MNFNWKEYLDADAGILVAAIATGLLIVWFFIRRIRKKAASTLIIPTILYVPELVKRNSLKVKLAIPKKDHPAKFTIYSEGGRPLQQVILKGSRRRARIKINGLENGTYRCDVSNAGSVSESKIFRLSRKN